MRLKRLFIFGLLPLALGTGALADECTRNDPILMLPDLVALPPTRIRVAEQNAHRFIFFTTTIANIGDGPLIMHGKTIDTPDGPKTQGIQEIWRTDGSSCTRVAGFFELHPQHHHFHFEDFSDYLLRKDDPFTGQIVAKSEKVSFCLLDIAPIVGFRGFPQFPNDCQNPEGTQGISVGFADVYESGLPGQNIDLDPDPTNPLPFGNYFLVNVVNPGKNIWEKNDDPQANAGVVSIGLGMQSGRPRGPGSVRQPRPPHVPRSPNSPRPGGSGPARGPHQPHQPRGPQH